MNLTKKKFIITIAFAAVFSLSAFFSTKAAHADTTPLQGWGWSSNTGWISFSSANAGAGSGGAYNVTLSTTTDSNLGTFGGYAWSSNIGWIKFAADGSHSNPTVDLSTGDVTGWIRACAGTVTNDCNGASRTDGWDGWIHLSDPTGHPTHNTDGTKGVTYDPASGLFNGYAWGSDVVGWLTFGSQYTQSHDQVHCIPNDTCPGGGGGTITAVCNVPASATILSGQTTAHVVPIVGSFANGTGSYSFSPSSFDLAAGNHALSVTISDSAVPPHTAQIACGNTVVSNADTNSGLNMWIQGSANNPKLSSITIKTGANAIFNWSSDTISSDDCIGTIFKPDGSQIPLIASQLKTGIYTFITPPLGTSFFNVSCKNPAGTYIPAQAPNGDPKLKVIVKDSTIIEI